MAIEIVRPVGSGLLNAPAPSAGTFDFASDWGTATGQGDTALRDGNRWTEHINYANANLLEVVPATGLGFPSGMTNVLRVRQDGSNAGHVAVREDQDGGRFPLPGIGEYMFFRVYWRHDISNDQGNLGRVSNHPYENYFGNIQWAFNWGPRSNGTVEVGGAILDFVNFPFGAQLQPNPNKFQVYMMEHRLRRTGVNSWGAPAIRLNGVDNTADWYHPDFMGNSAYNIPNLHSNTATRDDSLFRRLLLGANGPQNWTTASDQYVYYGGMAVRVTADANAWPGPYVPGEAD